MIWLPTMPRECTNLDMERNWKKTLDANFKSKVWASTKFTVSSDQRPWHKKFPQGWISFMCAMFTLTIQICFSKKVLQKTLFIFVKGLKETGTRFVAQILYCLSLDFYFYIVFNEFGSRELTESVRHGSKILLFAWLATASMHGIQYLEEGEL